jgi:ribosomal protein S13
MMPLTDSDKKRKALNLFQNLYLIAVADSKLAQEEKDSLIDLAHQLGIGIRDAYQIMSNIKHLDFAIPENDQEKLEQLREIVRMMLIDDELHDTEKNLCLAYTKKIGYAPITLEQIIEQEKAKKK